MGVRTWWEERVLPRAVDATLTDVTAGSWRRTTTAGLHGDVLELGFGSGRNLPYYPPEVSRVLAVDAVVSTWTLCTIPELDAALAEAQRVLRPGGELRFVEHSIAPGGLTRRVQQGVQPVWGRFAGGCHLDRDITGHLTDAGFRVGLDHAGYVVPHVMRPWGWFVHGRAHPA